jgi:phosphomannomutase
MWCARSRSTSCAHAVARRRDDLIEERLEQPHGRALGHSSRLGDLSPRRVVAAHVRRRLQDGEQTVRQLLVGRVVTRPGSGAEGGDPFDYASVELLPFQASGKLEIVDFETRYVKHVEANFDLEAIRKSGLNFVYDAMYGAGQNVIRRILPEVELLHCEHNPSFHGQAPEPIAKNLQPLERFIKEHGNIHCALATDGDADRIGLYNGKGEFIDSHHIILLLMHYLVKYKGQHGKAVTAFSTTPRVGKLAEHYGLPYEVVKIGFKYIAGIMVEQDVLIGGEESGGIAVKGHIPERDGIWMGLIIWEFMAKSRKTLDELIAEVYEIVGPFKFERNDLHLTETLKNQIVANCNANAYKNFGKYAVRDVGTIDGWKFFFDDNRWLMIRASGTEPVLRTYAEAPTLEEVREILKITEDMIRN